ncbi:MAG: hypothetical protein JNL09_05075 [Anaerolineales bacterium]|nr:hypothetical protein [Anaerolineales bacterium]
MATTVVSSTRLSFNKIALGTLITGVLSAVLNNVYSGLFTAFTGNSLALIGPVSITLASLIPTIVAGVAYYALTRLAGQRTGLLYLIGTLGFTLLSFGGPLGGQLPDGSIPPAFFAALTLPMHVIAGGLAAFALPYFAQR